MKKYGFPIYALGYIIIIVSTILFIISGTSALYNYNPIFFTVGIILTIVGKYLTLPEPTNFKIKRLNNILAVGAIFLVASAYFIFKGKNAFIITLTISAFIDLFTSFRYPKYKDEK